MRSRTEMVTTTFVDSEEDYSDDDDSEEDWRPSASSKNGKRQKCGGNGSAKRGRKRKSSSGQGNKNAKRKAVNEDSGEDEVDEVSEDDCDYDEFETTSGSSKKNPANFPEKKQFFDKNSSSSTSDDIGDTLNLLVYVKDLTGTDLNKNNRLCLWRKDNSNLLQKYIRVKTSPEQFIFTSSSVYSSFDDKRISDFYDIKVKSIDSSNRRVKILNPSELQNISLKTTRNKNSNEEILIEESDLKENKQNCVKYGENFKNTHKPLSKDHEDDDEEEEVEEENDEEEDDCDLEEDDDDDIEDDDGDD